VKQSEARGGTKKGKGRRILSEGRVKGKEPELQNLFNPLGGGGGIDVGEGGGRLGNLDKTQA